MAEVIQKNPHGGALLAIRAESHLDFLSTLKKSAIRAPYTILLTSFRRAASAASLGRCEGPMAGHRTPLLSVVRTLGERYI